MVMREWAGLRVSRRAAGPGRDLRRWGRLWLMVLIAAVVTGACLVMFVIASGHADRGCSARCSQFEGGMVAGGSRQAYQVVRGGQPGMQKRGFNG